jgi:GTP-binding protein EngB required for normal cell division
MPGAFTFGTSPNKITTCLDRVSELNILILGETGVGKSTFINAFTNYLNFSSLNEALQAKELACVIPSFFNWHSLEGDDYVTNNIKVKPNVKGFTGDNLLQNETDSSNGQPATQDTQVYPVEVGNTIVRVIDTPGIGDTRGAAQDQINMSNIITSLGQFKELHGILVLLKSNSARLDIMFKFCLKERLIHFHRDAAKNIAFGFTNARNTSFRPGETYNLLAQMLKQDQSIGIHLSRRIAYCFDSESFRCLAAHSNGVDIHDMSDIQDYQISWEKSAKEAFRLLEHFTPAITKPTL